MWTRVVPFIAVLSAVPSQGFAGEHGAVSVADHADFRGGYIGLEGGYLSGDGEAVLGAHTGSLIQLDTSNGLFPDKISNQSGIGAVTAVAGYNRQVGRTVIGVEADATYSGYSNTHSFSRIDPNPAFLNTPTNTSYTTKIERFATLRGRIGHTVGNTLIYGTAGVAVGEIENAFSLELPLVGYAKNTWKAKDTKFGYAVGLGVEHKLTANLNLRLSGQYIGFENTEVTASDPPTFGENTLTYKFRNDLAIVRAGLAYRF